MKKKYLPLYHKWLKQGLIDPIYDDVYNGMCHIFEEDKLFALVRPTPSDLNDLESEDLCTAYWGSLCPKRQFDNTVVCGGFTSMRQNLVLLMAAMNNEL